MMNKYQTILCDIFRTQTSPEYTQFVRDRLVETDKIYSTLNFVSAVDVIVSIFTESVHKNQAPELDRWVGAAGDCLFHLTVLGIRKINLPVSSCLVLNLVYKGLESDLFPQETYTNDAPDLEWVSINKILNQEEKGHINHTANHKHN